MYVCPMDPDVRSNEPGVCRRCGMKLAAGVPDPVEFHLDLASTPPAPAAGRQSTLRFLVRDPWKERPVTTFTTVHEKLFHAFVVSQDLEFFEHGHPAFNEDGTFELPIAFPKPGMYRVLADFYPAGATPQLIAETLFVPGTAPKPPTLRRDYSAKEDRNLRVSLATIPERPTAATRTQLRVSVDAPRGLERYLGAWSHMLAASDDLIDMMHDHPFQADGGPQVEFEIVFPRPHVYRVWMQFQSDRIVNTVHFDILVG